MAIKKETIDVRYCDFCDSKHNDDDTYVMTCKSCGKDACNNCCHRMIVTYISPILSSSHSINKPFNFGAMLCKECVEVETKELKDFLCSRGFKEF